MIISKDVKFRLRNGNRYIYAGESEKLPFSNWHPRSKFLDDRIEAEKKALEMLRI